MPHEVKFTGPRTPQWGCAGCRIENFRCRPTCRKCEHRAHARLLHEIAAAATKAAGKTGGDGDSCSRPGFGFPMEYELVRLRRRISELLQQPAMAAADAAEMAPSADPARPTAAEAGRKEQQDLASKVAGYIPCQ